MPSDRPVDLPSIDSRLIHKGMVWNLVSETFDFLGEELTREFIDHPGAVAVLAINDNGEVLLLEQYRRPVKSFLLEVPAGLLDVPGESKVDCAKRELLEEASLTADSWSELITFHTTPGGSNESITVFVAREVKEVLSNHVQTGEERDMVKHWLPITDAMKLILDSRLKSPSAQVGIMAYALRNGFSGVS